MEGGRPVRLIVAIASVFGVLLLPGAAGAATVHVGQAPDSPYPCCRGGGNYSSANKAAYYLAAPGERNDVSVINDRPQGQPVRVTFHDEGAKVEAGEGCVSVDDHTARCSDVLVAQVQLGDENDKLHEYESTQYLGLLGTMRAFGGKGDDLLVGGPFWDELYGGGGRDELHGGGFDDVLSDGDRSGAKGEARPGPDVMDGGSGSDGGSSDMISYGQRTAPVTIDLRTGRTAGEKGEGDAISGFEYAYGGAGNDRLTGNKGANDIFGNGGNDVLRGLAGQNSLYGGAGRDRLIGGDLGDYFGPGPGLDSLSCGSGDDRVESPAAGELLGRCELMFFLPPPGNTAWNTFTQEPHPQSVSRTAARFAIDCPQFDPGEQFQIKPCAGTVTLRKAFGRHVLLGRARKNDYGPFYLPVKLTAAGRRLVHRKGGVVTTVSLRGAKSAGNPLPKVDWTIRLKG
jgi:hemolysin type calcium-binding protein